MGNTIGDNAIGVTSLAAGSYLGYKGITSGLRRALGVRIEEHTTNLKNAKSIIKDGCILNPAFGGSAASSIFETYKDNSKNFVHITGYHKNLLTAFDPEIQKIIKNNKYTKLILETPLLHPVRAIYRKYQRLIYRWISNSKIVMKADEKVLENLDNMKITRTSILKKICKTIIGKDTKTFFCRWDR